MCASSPTRLSAREEGCERSGAGGGGGGGNGGGGGGGREGGNVSEGDSMSGSAVLAPTHFTVSITTSGSASGEKEIDRGVSVSTSESFCPCRLCGRRRRPLTCASCVNAGNFVHSEAGLGSSSPANRRNATNDVRGRFFGPAVAADDDDDDDFALPFHAKAEKLTSLLSLKAGLVDNSLGHVEKNARLQEWNTRILVQDEKLRLLRRAVEERKAANRKLGETLDEAKERAAQMQLRERKHNEKVAKIRKFLPHSTSRRDEKQKELDSLKDELKTWRRRRIEHLVTHIFVIDEDKGQPPLPSQHDGFDHPASSTTTPTTSISSSPASRLRHHHPPPPPPPPQGPAFHLQQQQRRRESPSAREPDSERFVPSSHTGDPPNRKWSRNPVDVIPLLLEVNKGFDGAYQHRALFGSDHDELPPTQLPVCEDVLDDDLSIMDDDDEEEEDDDDEDDDDDSIISQLENSLMPMDQAQRESESDDQTSLPYGNLKPLSKSYYRIIRPTLPASGDYAKILPLIVQSQKTSTPTLTVPDPATGKMVQVEGHSSPRRVRIEKDLMQNAYAGLALTAQLVTCLSFYLDVILPKKVAPADFMIKLPKVSSFIKSVNKLSTNVLFLCFSQYVPPNVLQPSQMMHNIQMLLNTTVTPHLGSIHHFRVNETLLDSLEESVVIVGNASSGSNDLDFSSSSSSSSDDEGKDETTSGEWDYIPADMNIPSMPLNEGFGGGAETSTLAGGLSSYSITGAAASVASWWRSNR